MKVLSLLRINDFEEFKGRMDILGYDLLDRIIEFDRMQGDKIYTVYDLLEDQVELLKDFIAEMSEMGKSYKIIEDKGMLVVTGLRFTSWFFKKNII